MKDKLSWLLSSRRRVVLVTLGILLLFDLGRSAYARVGYSEPAELWHAAPYEALAWPPGADLSADTPLGERVYIESCAVCHGTSGQGNGPAAPSMIPRPRDFTLGEYKYQTTLPGQAPSDDDLLNVVANGLQASAMPYSHDVLNDAELEAVVDYIKDFSPVFDGSAPEAVNVPQRVSPDADSLARGEALYARQGCAGCHGQDGRAMATLQDSKGYPVIARDLTAPWTFRGGSEAEQIWLRLTTGLAPSPMPSFADKTAADERWDLVNYVLSLARTAPFEAGGVLDGPGFQNSLLKRGEYLTHFEMCGLCHTQVNEDMIYSGDDYYMAGGMAIPANPQGTFVSRNLTSDSETGLGDWTVEEVADAIRNGQGA